MCHKNTVVRTTLPLQTYSSSRKGLWVRGNLATKLLLLGTTTRELGSSSHPVGTCWAGAVQHFLKLLASFQQQMKPNTAGTMLLIKSNSVTNQAVLVAALPWSLAAWVGRPSMCSTQAVLPESSVGREPWWTRRIYSITEQYLAGLTIWFNSQDSVY